jgi:hypothetical protein
MPPGNFSAPDSSGPARPRRRHPAGTESFLSLLDRHDPDGTQPLPEDAPQLLALLEVDTDFRALAAIANGAALMRELRRRVAILCDPLRSPNALPLKLHRSADLSDIHKQKIGIPQQKGHAPLRWLYQPLPAGGYLVVYVGLRHAPDHEVYAEARARLGRGEGFTLTDGTDVTVSCTLTDDQRQELWPLFGIHPDPYEPDHGSRRDDRRVHLTASRAHDSAAPYTDHFVLGWDEKDGRRADIEFFTVTDELDSRNIAYSVDW